MSLTPVLLHMLFFHCPNFLALLALANMSKSCKGITSSVEYLSPLLPQTGFGPLPDLFYHSPELYLCVPSHGIHIVLQTILSP